jgi:hypothetical protein
LVLILLHCLHWRCTVKHKTKEHSFENWGAMDTKILSLRLVFEGLMCSCFYLRNFFIYCCCYVLETVWWRHSVSFIVDHTIKRVFVQLSTVITSPWRHAHFLLSQTLIVTKGNPMGSSEIPVPTYQTPQHLISEESNIHRQRFEHARSCKHSELRRRRWPQVGGLYLVRMHATSGVLHVMFPSRTKRFMIYSMIVLCIKTRKGFKIPSCWFCALVCIYTSETLPAIFKNLNVTMALFGTFYLLNSSSFSFPL